MPGHAGKQQTHTMKICTQHSSQNVDFKRRHSGKLDQTASNIRSDNEPEIFP